MVVIDFAFILNLGCETVPGHGFGFIDLKPDAKYETRHVKTGRTSFIMPGLLQYINLHACFLSLASTVKLRYNNPRYNNIPSYNNIFSVDQKLYLLINAIRYNNMIHYNNI